MEKVLVLNISNIVVTKKQNKQEKQKQIYSYEFDADYIYSAFLQQYKIDLNSIKYMHWWKFKDLFEVRACIAESFAIQKYEA